MPASEAPAAPLEGVRVLDFTRLLAGPFCTMLLADLGADVLKVETADHPDGARTLGGGGSAVPYSSAFAILNRNKRSVAVDVGRCDGREVLERLAATSDVVIENFRPGVAANLGIGYQQLAQLHPGLVYASISGFGQTGPLSPLGGYDLVAQAMSGIMSVTGQEHAEPAKVGVPITDIAAGTFAAVGILAALHARHRTGRGRHVDCSLLDAGVAFGVWEAAEHWASNTVPGPLGNAHRALAPYQAVRASDGWFVIAANTDEMFCRCSAVFGQPGWPADERFATNNARLAHRRELTAAIEAVTIEGPVSKWVDALRSAGVPSGEVLDYPAVLRHEQVVGREMVIPPSDGASHPLLGTPIRLSEMPPTQHRPAPMVGEHTAEVLREHGYSERQIQHLRDTGALFVA